MSYIDCYIAPVPRENRAAYEQLAKISAEVLKEQGALRVIECWLDENGPDVSTYHGEDAREESSSYNNFFTAAGASENETVVVSYVEWPDKSARDLGMEKMTSDPRMQFHDLPPTFEGKRLIAGGFIPMLDSAKDR